MGGVAVAVAALVLLAGTGNATLVWTAAAVAVTKLLLWGFVWRSPRWPRDPRHVPEPWVALDAASSLVAFILLVWALSLRLL